MHYTHALQVLLLAWLVFLLCMAREVPWKKWTHGQVDGDFTKEKDAFTTEDDYFTREHDQQKGFDYRRALILLGKIMTNKPCVVVAVAVAVAVVVVVAAAVVFYCGHWNIEFHDMIYNHPGMIFGLPEIG